MPRSSFEYNRGHITHARLHSPHTSRYTQWNGLDQVLIFVRMRSILWGLVRIYRYLLKDVSTDVIRRGNATGMFLIVCYGGGKTPDDRIVLAMTQMVQ